MSHDAIENMPSAPPTPTISSVGSELSFEDVTSRSPIGGGPKEHPELFHSDHMVTIQVEETLFRIPAYFLTQDSAHFAGLLENEDAGFMMHVTDADVSSAAFANLLVVLRPRLGVTPISTLSEWTDVLHLSTKWGFEHLRTAAITAILPLASAVDKLVLGRTYGFVDWVPGAYTDLLKREDDLTLDEAKKMALEDVVAIAKGRREARTQSVRPDQDIVHIVKNLLSTHAPAETTSEDAVPPAIASELVRPPATTAAPSTKPAPDRGSVDVENEVKILQWLDRMSCSASRGAAQECLVKFMQEDRARVPVILDTILATGLGSITRAVERGSDLIIYRKYSHSYFNMWDATADGGQHLLLRNMHALDQTLGLVNTAQIEAACFRFADHWRALRRLDLDLLASDVLATPIWRSIDHALTYMVYLHEGPNSYSGQSFSVIRAPAFSAFWVELNSVLKSTPSSGQVVLAHCINVLLKKHGARISKLAVSPEMDAFYLTVSEKRDAAKGSHDHPLVALLEDIITARKWPSV